MDPHMASSSGFRDNGPTDGTIEVVFDLVIRWSCRYLRFGRRWPALVLENGGVWPSCELVNVCISQKAIVISLVTDMLHEREIDQINPGMPRGGRRRPVPPLH
jgi:hypothetical protein